MASTNEPRPGILKQESREAMSPSSLLGVNISPRATPKSVSIAPHAEVVSPLVLGNSKNMDAFQLDDSAAGWRMAVKGPNSKRLSGRPSICPSPSVSAMTKSTGTDGSHDHISSSHMPKHVDQVIEDVATWLRHQRQKRASRRHKRHARHEAKKDEGESQRRTSEDSTASLDLDNLEDIIKHSLKLEHTGGRKLSLKPRRPSLKKLHRSTVSASSDTEIFDGAPLVPGCDVVLDNTRTLACSLVGGGYDESDDSSDELKRTRSYKDLDAWAKFKYEIVRLTHTLRLKGWRQVPMEESNDIAVERLSGALTNCVYVVSPPDSIDDGNSTGSSAPTPRKRKPQKLLLRIYGPQVEHLIDRDIELQILQRLARKRIGPRMLGTFANGRFEEFFNAKPLTPDDMRNPDTSRQIAKRMRELHDGIELLDEERNNIPFVWQNWDKWLPRVEKIGTWLDSQINELAAGDKPTGSDTWKRRGYILGVQWKVFQSTVEKYRAWQEKEYGGLPNIKDKLVFAHNDTQYGNILRLVPSGESPLLLPANTHKQLVVIDFEYANANLPGLEFANHFTEWCYNYHDKRKPYACNTKLYPTPEEQDRFVRAYVRHRPQYNISTPKLVALNSSASTDSIQPLSAHQRSTSSLTNFMLDARTPANAKDKPQQYDESAELAAENAEVTRYLHETRLWRLANSAQWTAWGLVQAEVPGMPDFSDPSGPDAKSNDKEMDADEQRVALKEVSDDIEAVASQEQASEAVGALGQSKEEAEEEFDYLGYAQHRAMFFWGDALQMGFVKAEDLPEEMLAKVKMVKY